MAHAVLAKLNAFKADNPTMGEVSNPRVSQNVEEQASGWNKIAKTVVSLSDGFKNEQVGCRNGTFSSLSSLVGRI